MIESKNLLAVSLNDTSAILLGQILVDSFQGCGRRANRRPKPRSMALGWATLCLREVVEINCE